MRGGKDEDKVISPMFPRLHANDTEKGGPRAPPRNKMALYEQLSVPSQRGSASLLPLPASNGATLVPLTSSSTHGGGFERRPFIPFCNSLTLPQSSENHRSYSSTGANFIASLESTKPTEYPSSNTTSITKLHSFQPPKFSKIKKHGGEDVVPTFAPLGIVTSPCSNTQQSKDQEHMFPLFHMSSSWQLQAADPKSRQHVTNQTGANPKVCQIRQDSVERSVSIVSMRDKILVDSPPCHSTKDKTSGVKWSHASLEQKQISLLDAINKRHGTDARFFQECLNLRDKPTLLKDSLRGMVEENVPNVVSDTCSRPSAGGTNGPKRLANGSEYCEDEEYGYVKAGEPKKDNDISDSSMLDSDSVLDISPDDVVGVLGDKHFWKARRAIVTQQRVFTVQVFELHRLVKVQRLIAGSPNFLLEDHLEGSLAKKLSSESALKPRNGSETPNPETKFGSESAFSTHALPQKPSYGPFSGSQLPPPPPVTSNINTNKPSPWFFHPPPANQWLVPVMSPSEGFVYKPFTSADPPNVSGLMAPFFGNYESPRNGDLLNTTGYGSHAYFTPLMNPSVSGSTLEHENQLSQMSRAIGKQQATNESELQGSTASSPSLRVNGEALPLFPMASDLNASEPPQPKKRVIKVVPHNPRSATESAARIFQFIQEERKQFD